jgi:hypothetical protein
VPGVKSTPAVNVSIDELAAMSARSFCVRNADVRTESGNARVTPLQLLHIGNLSSGENEFATIRSFIVVMLVFR